MSEATKVCGICGANCAGKPRIKDPSGQYYCKGCHDEAMAQKRMLDENATAPTRVASADDLIGFANDDLHAAEARDAAAAMDDVGPGGGGGDMIDALNDLLPNAGAPAPGVGCPSCGQATPPGAIVCINCGHNYESGGQAATTISKPKKVKGGGGGDFKVSISPGLVFLLLLALPSGIAALGFAGMEGMPMVAIFVLWAIGAVAGLWMLVASFMDSILQGLLVLIVPFYALYWLLARCENPYLKAMFGAYILAAFVVVGIAFATVGEDFLSDLQQMPGMPER